MNTFFEYGFYVLAAYVAFDLIVGYVKNKSQSVNEEKMIGSRPFPIVVVAQSPYDKTVSERAEHFRAIIREQNEIRQERNEPPLEIPVIEIYHSDAGSEGEDYYWHYWLKVSNILNAIAENYGSNVRQVDLSWYKKQYVQQN